MLDRDEPVVLQNEYKCELSVLAGTDMAEIPIEGRERLG